MRIGVLAQPGNWSLEQITLAAKERGHTVVTLEFHELSGLSGVPGASNQIFGAGANRQGEREQIPLRDLDTLIVRTMPSGSLEQVVTRMNLLALAERAGLRVINSPRSLECAIDKYLTTARLVEAGVPIPATCVCETASEAVAAFHRLGGKVVLKPLFGSEGRGIFRLDDAELLWRVAQTLVRTGAVLYLQEFIDHGGHDLRIIVLDGQPLGAMRRSSQNDFRTNIALGGQSSHVELTDETASLAIRAAQAVGTVFAGIDLIQDPSGRWVVLEVNGVPGWKAFAETTGIPVAQRLMGFLERQA